MLNCEESFTENLLDDSLLKEGVVALCAFPNLLRLPKCGKTLSQCFIFATSCHARAFPKDFYGFKRSLSHSQGRHRYILFTCDYETHHPEVIPLCIIDARTIAGELIKICNHTEGNLD